MTFQQSFAWWSFAEGRPEAASLLEAASSMGYAGVDFLPVERWPQAADLGLELVVIDGHVPIEVGFIDPVRHAGLQDQVRRALDLAVAHHVRHLTVTSGNRGPHSADDAISACADGLAPLAAEAEAAGVGLLLEPLNTKVDHDGHECATTAWAARVVDLVGSPALRMLYDFYHSQLMEGDLFRTVAEQLPRIGHFHTAGVPGRHDLDDDQEVNYRAVARYLRRLGYAGYIAHEFIPRADPAEALRDAYMTFASF